MYEMNCISTDYFSNSVWLMYALPEGGTEDAKIKALSVDNPKLVTVLTFEARVGQNIEFFFFLKRCVLSRTLRFYFLPSPFIEPHLFPILFSYSYVVSSL